MIVRRTPKGWTGPKTVDGKPTEGSYRSHQVPLAGSGNPQHLMLLEEWLRSYRPEELFGRPRCVDPGDGGTGARGDRRMGANPHANGGALLRDLEMPDFRNYAIDVTQPGVVTAEPTRVMGGLLRDVLETSRPATSASSDRTKPRPTGWPAVRGH